MSNKENRTEAERIIVENEIDTSDMRNKDRKLKFIEETQLTGDDKVDTNLIRRFNQLGRSENRVNKDFLEFNRSEFIHFFEEYPWAYGTFGSVKSLIKMYLEWGRDNKLTDGKNIRELEDITYDIPSHQKMYDKYYFRNLSELAETIESYSQKYSNVNVKIKFRITEIAILLAWCGVRLKDILEIRQSDLNESDRTIFVVGENKYIKVPKDESFDIFKVITDYRDSVDYVDSDKLIRSTNIINIKLGYVSALMSRYFGDSEFNGTDNEKVFNYNKVYWSGIFSRAREYEIEHGELQNTDTEILGELFQEDYSDNPYTTSKRLLEYHTYLAYMCGKEYYKY